MSKKGSTTTQTSAPDQFGDQARRAVWDKAMKVGSQPYQAYGGQRVAGPNGMTTDALNNAGQTIRDFQQNGRPQGFLDGNVQDYMNPYQQGVLDNVHGDYDRIRQSTMNQTNDAATRAGAFGGSRHGVAEGIALGDVGRAEGSQLAQLRQSGYNDAANRMTGDQQSQYQYQQDRLGTAGQMQNLGLQGGGYLRNVQQQGLDANYENYQNQQNWGARNLGLLSGAQAGMPQYGTQSLQTPGSGLGGVLGGVVGGALSIGSMFRPGGGFAGLLGGGMPGAGNIAADTRGINPAAMGIAPIRP